MMMHHQWYRLWHQITCMRVKTFHSQAKLTPPRAGGSYNDGLISQFGEQVIHQEPHIIT